MRENFEWVRSRSYTWGASSEFEIDLSFLDKIIKSFRQPELGVLKVVFRGSVTAGAGGPIAGEDACRILSNGRVYDVAGAIVDQAGTMWRAMAQAEYGSRYIDPANVLATVTNANYWLELPLTFEPYLAYGPNEFRMPAVLLREGKGINLVMNDATPGPNFTVNSGTIQVWAKVYDAKSPHLRSRLVWKDQPMNADEDDYRFPDGSIRALLGVAPDTDANGGYVSWASNRTVNIPELRYVDMRRELQRYEYIANQVTPATGNIIVDEEAFPFFMATAEQEIGELPEYPGLRLELGEARPTGARLLSNHITDREPRMSAAAAGFGSVAALQAAIENRGEVITKSGGVPAKEFGNLGLLPRLNIKLPGSDGGEGVLSALRNR